MKQKISNETKSVKFIFNYYYVCLFYLHIHTHTQAQCFFEKEYFCYVNEFLIIFTFFSRFELNEHKQKLKTETG